MQVRVCFAQRSLSQDVAFARVSILHVSSILHGDSFAQVLNFERVFYSTKGHFCTENFNCKHDSYLINFLYDLSLD